MYSSLSSSDSQTVVPPTYRNSHCRRRAQAVARAVHEREQQHDGAELDAEEAGGQHHVRRADDLDVEAVRVVPPVVERRGDEHRDAAPGRDERAERAATAPRCGRSTSAQRAASPCGRTSS